VNSNTRAIRERAAAVRRAGIDLRRATVEARANWLAEAADTLLGDTLAAGDALAEATGLSRPMVEWGARTTLSTIEANALCMLAKDAQKEGSDPISLLSLVLAGNLFTASVRAIVVPLLLGVPVLAKASSRETSFPEMLRDALRGADPVLGRAVDLVAFEGGNTECEKALVEGADALAVYGSDETVEAIGGRHPETRFIAHGHGVSAAYCGADALRSDRGRDTLTALSLDVCAYDQRGCLSPQVIYVQETAELSALAFAERLAAEGLAPLSEALPRGPLPMDVGAAQAQWRGLAEVEGTLIAGDAHAIAVRPPELARWSPGYRNVNVCGVRGLAEAMRAMGPLGAHLKCVGASVDSLAELEAALEQDSRLSAYACPHGTMQTPPLDAPADAHPIWHALLR
jgi:acyl-CoA reductase-like NAD-dependent aldehyde dehydrogenase